MKKNKITSVVFLSLGIIAVSALATFSGCTDIVGIDTDYVPNCEWKATIEGPDEIFFDPCESNNEVKYELFVEGQPLNLQDVGTWDVQGDLKIVSAGNTNPLIVMATTVNLGIGEITFSAKSSGECETPEGQTIVLARKSVNVILNKLNVTSNVCIDTSTGMGGGTLTVIDKVPGSQNYNWTIFPAGAADLYPQPGTPFCTIQNATGNFSIRVEKFGTSCVNEVTVDIQVPNCN